MRISGGSGAQAGLLGGLARLVGDDPNGAADAARAFRERLASSPLAQATIGHGVLGAGTGQLVNQAQLYIQAQREILEARTDEEARVRAQVYGMERLLPLREADARLIHEQIRAAEENGRAVDDQLRRMRANEQTQKALMGERFEELGIAMQRRLLPSMQGLEEAIGDVAHTAAGVINNPGGVLGDLYRNAMKIFTDPASLGPFHPSIGGVTPRAGGGAQSSTERLIGSLDANTEQLRTMNKDWLNGRERTNRAWPRNLGGEGLNRALEEAAFNLGAVTF